MIKHINSKIAQHRGHAFACEEIPVQLVRHHEVKFESNSA